MGLTRISRNDTGSGYTIRVDAGTDGSIVVLSNEGGEWLSRVDEAGNQALVAAAPSSYSDLRYGEIETLSNGRYAVHVAGSQFGGSRLQIINANGTDATGVINPMFEDEDRWGQGYTLTETSNGGFAFVWNDLSRSSDSFAGTSQPYNGNPNFNSNANADVRVRYFDANGVAAGASTVADEDVETVNGATISRRALDQYINDTETLAGGQIAFAYMDFRWVGNPAGGATQDWQLSLQIATPGNVGEPIKIDLQPLNNNNVGDYPQALEPGSASANIVPLPDGTFAVIWSERTFVPANVYGGYAPSGWQTLIRYFNASGQALTDATTILTRGNEHENFTKFVWGEALPDGRIAIAYNVGVYGVNGNGTLNAFAGVIGVLGSSVQVSQLNAAAQNGQFYTIQDMDARTDGTIDVVYNDASLNSSGVNRNVTVIDRLAVTGPGETARVGTSSPDTFNGGAAGETMFGQAGGDTISGIGGDDRLHGGSGDDKLNGGAANDRLFGDAGNDVLDGGVGADRMEGGLGNDIYIVDSSLDRVVEAVGAGTDTVRSSISFTLAPEFENLVLVGTAAKGTGNAIGNTLVGSDAPNTLEGGIGNDTLNGRGGSDTLDGGDGADKLLGGVASDILSGGAANDTLYGEGGNDRLSGGAGLDRFYFDSALNPSTNVDKILDFSVADDSIYLSRSIFGGIAANGSLAAAAFHRGASAADASDRIIYDQAAGKIFYDADGAGGAAQVLFATVTAGTALTSADFVVYG
jgi:hypothetical protein